MDLFSELKILRYFLIFLAFSFFYRTGETMQPGKQYATALAAIEKGGICRSVTADTHQRVRDKADWTCYNAFVTLDRSGFNVCRDWQQAECRSIQSIETWECSVFVPGWNAFSTLENCAPDLPQQRRPTVTSCWGGTGQTSGSGKGTDDVRKKRRHNLRSPAAGSSRNFEFNPGSSSSAIPPFGQRGTSSFDFTQLKRLGIPSLPGASDEGQEQSSAIPSHNSSQTDFAWIKRFGLENPSDVGSHGQDQSSTIPSYKTSQADFARIRRFGLENPSDAGGHGQYQSSATPSCNPSQADFARIRRFGLENPYDVGDLGQSYGAEFGKQGSSETAGKLPRFQCPECSNSYKTERILLDHMHFHKGGTTCPIEWCRKTFQLRSKYLNHMIKAHDIGIDKQPLKYACDKCPKKFAHENSLSAHRAYHTDATLCVACGHRYATEFALRRHIESVHKDQSPAPHD
nr:PREDICTED: zinc finger protein 177-like [Bemisia tabaci]